MSPVEQCLILRCGVDLILDEKVSDVHVIRAFGAETLSVPLEED
jgi:hypothetical protein